MPEHHHRSTLKQQNKSFKGSSSSKRAIKRINKGKVPGAVSGPVASGGDALARKSQRANAAKQARDAKRQELLKQKRGIGSSFAGPRVVAIANVTRAGNVAQAKAKVLDGARIVAGSGSTSEEGPVTAEISGGGKVTVVETGREMVGFLDCMTVADILVLVVTAGDEVMDGLGQHLVLTARNFALPSAICVIVQGLEAKDRAASLKKWGQLMQDAVIRDDVKVLSDSPADVTALHRFIAATKLSARPAWQQHSQILAQSVKVVETGGDLVGLEVCGYVKSKAMTADQLIHIPSYGTYQVKAIERYSDPLSGKVRHHEMKMEAAGSELAERFESGEAREELTMEEEDNGMEGEQTWPSHEELKEARMRTRRVPKYMGEYASAWIPEDEEDDWDYDENGEEGSDGMVDGEGEGEGMEEEEEDEEAQNAPIEDDEDDEGDDDETMSMAPEEEERARNEWAARRADEQEEKDYPDEVEAPGDQPARERFARYRGLRSLRTSPWDPYENLPAKHHKIIHLSSPAMSRAKALRVPEEGKVEVGAFVLIYIERVQRAAAESIVTKSGGGGGAYAPLVVTSLAKYENRMGMVHWRMTSYRGESNSIRSKDTLVLVQGGRRCEIRPVFSEVSETASNHKMHRFLPATGSCVASAYAPIWWGPSPVLLMQKQKSGALTLVAVGSTLPPNANRIILKRIVLSGLPFKIHKRKATIRFMFHNPEDVRWFKAVEVWTKFGRRGIIREALGTHGYMKCTFDSPIAHHDTVCMALYKRVFPPYPTDPAKQLLSPSAP